jgi:bifunctional non-homologous end joining protein LigD
VTAGAESRHTIATMPKLHAADDDAPIVAGVRISHPDRVIYPDLGITKLDLARYYEAVADWIVPHVAGRPLTLVHCPKGLAGPCHYLKHSKLWGPDVLRRVRIQEKTKIGEYLVADDAAGVIGLAQMGVLEIHTWNSTTADVEKPNRIVWDLDPGPRITWSQVVMAAHLVRDVLETLGLESWVKTTGGSGLHVVVPIVPRRAWSDCLLFSRAVAQAITATNPAQFTTAFAKSGRESKILIDYLRNNRTNTSVAALSTRARAGAVVSMPIAWKELTPRLRPQAFTIKTAARRMKRRDAWQDYWTVRQHVSDAAFRAVTRL